MEDSSVSEAMNSSMLSSSKKPCNSAFVLTVWLHGSTERVE